ncbi:MAG: U32 family peptidase, partial [Deltaproteobacteria bacterium]
LVEALEAAIERGRVRKIDPAPALAPVRTALRAAVPAVPRPDAPTLVPLCRLDAQLDAAIALGFREVELDWMEMVGLGHAVARARAAGVRVTLATTRVQKPGEEQLDQRIARLDPDGVLVRHWGGLMYFADGGGRELAHTPSVHGDFSLNVTNSLTFWRLLGLGLDTVTASHDLDERQLMNLVAAVDPARLAVVLHHHIPTFHTEHCVYAHTLSDGADYRTCGRPCEEHEVSLRDPKGLAHPVIVDVFCRNTVFEARAQSAATLAPRLLEAGVRRFRVELVRESAEETTTVLTAYRELLAGRITPREAVRAVGVHEQFGVVRGVARSARDERSA